MRTDTRVDVEAAPEASKTFTLDLHDADAATNASSAEAGKPVLQWNDLSETEKSAASLGVDPEAWKPIGFMNSAHYDTLLKTNAIDTDLAKQLEAYKHVSTGGK